MTDPWPTVRDRIARRTDRIVSDLRSRWGTGRTVEPFDFGPRPYHPGVTRTTGLFDAAVFPEPCRDGEEIRRLLADDRSG